MKFAWADEIERWLPGVYPGDVSIVRSRNDLAIINSARIVIVSVGMFTATSAVAKAISGAHFRVVVVDESHQLKNSNAMRTKLISPIMKAARRLVLLSGTPALSRPVELYT